MENIPFLPLLFANKGLNAIDLGNMLELGFHFISKINLFLSFNIPMLHPLHPTSLTINVYCRTSALMASKLNLLIVLATIRHSNTIDGPELTRSTI
jgi:hypothetical protein